MIFKTTANAMNRKPERLSSTKVKGQNHKRRATPCDCIVGQFQALKGRQQTMCLLTPFQGLGSRIYPFHRALPDANAKRLSALTTYKFFISHS